MSILMYRNHNAALLPQIVSVNWVIVILALLSEANAVLVHEDQMKLKDLSRGPSQGSLIGWVNHSLAVQLFPTHLQELIAQLVGE